VSTKLNYRLSDQDGKVAGAGLSRSQSNHVGSVRIREGRTGNGHYRVFFWSFEWHTPTGSEIVSGESATWEQALDAATRRQHQCVYG